MRITVVGSGHTALSVVAVLSRENEVKIAFKKICNYPNLNSKMEIMNCTIIELVNVNVRKLFNLILHLSLQKY